MWLEVQGIVPAAQRWGILKGLLSHAEDASDFNLPLLYWYATDLNKPPIGDRKMRWPDTEWAEGNFHKLFPSYAEFWTREGDHGGPVAEPAPLEGFLNAMRRGAAAPKVKVRAD